MSLSDQPPVFAWLKRTNGSIRDVDRTAEQDAQEERSIVGEAGDDDGSEQAADRDDLARCDDDGEPSEIPSGGCGIDARRRVAARFEQPDRHRPHIDYDSRT